MDVETPSQPPDLRGPCNTAEEQGNAPTSLSVSNAPWTNREGCVSVSSKQHNMSEELRLLDTEFEETFTAIRKGLDKLEKEKQSDKQKVCLL